LKISRGYKIYAKWSSLDHGRIKSKAGKVKASVDPCIKKDLRMNGWRVKMMNPVVLLKQVVRQSVKTIHFDALGACV